MNCFVDDLPKAFGFGDQGAAVFFGKDGGIEFAIGVEPLLDAWTACPINPVTDELSFTLALRIPWTVIASRARESNCGSGDTNRT